MSNTLQDLKTLQALPLEVKIKKTEQRIKEWVDYYGEDGVYISFSGGKDSTVLLDICRKLYPNMKAAFIDTGLEYPEIRTFVKSFDNVDIIKPKMNFKKVVEKYGYPFIGKEVSQTVYEAKRYFLKLANEEFGFKPSGNEINDQAILQEILESEKLREVITERPKGDGSRTQLAKILHMLKKDRSIVPHPDEKDVSDFIHCNKYVNMLTAPFNIGNGCCRVMKKSPVHTYEKQSGRVGIMGQMACESQLRANWWMKYGCNSFDKERTISNPMSFWLEQDVLLYIKLNNLPICKVYGDIVDENGNDVDVTGWEQYGAYDERKVALKTTRCERTGCMFCGYGCHRDAPGEGRFEKMREMYPNQYNYIMKPVEDGGMGYKSVIDWINKYINIKIRY